MENLLSKLFIALSIVGVGDGSYTAYEYITAKFFCSPTGTISCVCVAHSGHTSIFGIPFWVAGVTWFPFLLVFSLILTKGGSWSLRGDILLPVLLIGDLFTIYLWYLEIDIIGCYCPYCISLYVINYALTGLVIFDLLS